MRLAIFVLMLFLAAPALADGMADMKMPDDSCSDPFMAGMEKMHHDMMQPATGDADQDFARMMIPHHQGAVDMAQAELKCGHDPQLRQLAQKIIAAQQDEIKFMNAWLASHQGPR